MDKKNDKYIVYIGNKAQRSFNITSIMKYIVLFCLKLIFRTMRHIFRDMKI